MDEALRTMIRGYTREAGVRNLEREIGALLRHAAMRIAEGQVEHVRIDANECARESSATASLRRRRSRIAPVSRALRPALPGRGRR